MSKRNELRELERAWERDIDTLQKCAEFFNDPKYKAYADAARFVLQRCVCDLREVRASMKRFESAMSVGAVDPQD